MSVLSKLTKTVVSLGTVATLVVGSNAFAKPNDHDKKADKKEHSKEQGHKDGHKDANKDAKAPTSGTTTGTTTEHPTESAESAETVE